MKFVALISGGKDSLYSICKCIAYGHELVALANLYPSDTKLEDADSYMYQTVGHGVIQFYSAALQVPLFRKATSGKAVVTSLGYSFSKQDEVEDLYELLHEVKQSIPQVEAVSSGAILSNYQRYRVEHVCSRLNLISLSYLWRRSQKDLLQEMFASGVDAIVVKVAALGLLPRKHLGKHLVELEPLLLQLEHQYGSHVCGEGGEFESLVVDCPLFRYRLVIDDWEPVVVVDDKIAPTGYLRICLHHIEEKAMHIDRIQWISELVPKKTFLVTAQSQQDKQRKRQRKSALMTPAHFMCQSRWNVSNTFSYFLCCGMKLSEKETIANATVDEMRECLKELEESLKESSHTRKDVFYCQIYLGNMKEFAQVNEIYGSYFGLEQPPARACIEVSFPMKHRVVLEAFVCRERRNVLHVQSISEWAPLCIGPYCQGCNLRGTIFLSGILPIFPPTASIPNGIDIQDATQLCMQNVLRTVEAFPCDWKDVLFVYCYVTNVEDCQIVTNILFNKYNIRKHCAYCILPVSNLPRQGSIELQPILVNVDGDVLPGRKVLVRGNSDSFYSMGNGSVSDVSAQKTDKIRNVEWQVSFGQDLAILHVNWMFASLQNEPSHLSCFDWETQFQGIISEVVQLFQAQLAKLPIETAYSPVACRTWLPKDLVWTDSIPLQEVLERVVTKCLSSKNLVRCPVFIIPLDNGSMNIGHFQLMLQFDHFAPKSRL
eukprot:jgi/Galph1/2067/GphlegSOOS_G729.1